MKTQNMTAIQSSYPQLTHLREQDTQRACQPYQCLFQGNPFAQWRCKQHASDTQCVDLPCNGKKTRQDRPWNCKDKDRDSPRAAARLLKQSSCFMKGVGTRLLCIGWSRLSRASSDLHRGQNHSPAAAPLYAEWKTAKHSLDVASWYPWCL